jgi:stage II sporulation protein R
MKKIISMGITVLIILTFLTGIYGIKTIEAVSAKTLLSRSEQANPTVEEISEKLIRFHVIANSDREEDQALKLKVRDEVLTYIQPMLKDSESIEMSREILGRENDRLIQIAKEVIFANGYDYSVESTLSKEYFPIKTYGNITLPQGEYEAYRIIIGTGEGQNWWCVMFPPICFVDVTKGAVAYEETEEEMKEVLDEEEFNMVNNRANEKPKKGISSIFKFEKDSKSLSSKTTNSNNIVKKGNTNTSGENAKDAKKPALVDNTEDNNIVVKFKLGEIMKNFFNNL